MKVTYIGAQRQVGNKPPLLLVNEPSGTTKVYDPMKHELSEQDKHRMLEDEEQWMLENKPNLVTFLENTYLRR
jgi:hypothetical protein